MSTSTPPNALTIAGSDSGGGAGIQADLKTFAAFGVYGTSAITAVTAQHTRGVTAIQEIELDVIGAQIDAVVDDFGVDAVKTGMLASAPIVSLVADKAQQHGFDVLVVDPVMIAASGARLLQDDAIATITGELIPLATVVTPNVPEAEALSGLRVHDEESMKAAARAIHEMGAANVVVKGGHLESSERSDDVLFDGSVFEWYTATRITTTSTHGTGCTFASAIAAGLAHGHSVHRSVGAAKEYVTEAMRSAFPVGSGNGPLNHFHRWWNT